jgi:hypothetical protein
MSYDKQRRARGRDGGNTLDAIENNQDNDEQENVTAVADGIFGTEGASPQRSLRPIGDGRFSYGNITLTSTGIEWPENRIVDERMFEGLGHALLSFDGAIQWMIGDWLVYGDNHKWGETIRRVAVEFDKEISTIYVYKSIAANVLIRIKDLSFGHHQVVAPLEADAQVKWLTDAAQNKWSINQLRDAINKAIGKPTRITDILHRDIKPNLGKVETLVNRALTSKKEKDVVKARKQLEESWQAVEAYFKALEDELNNL